MQRPQIPAIEVEKAEAIAGFQAGVEARAAGHNPAAIRTLGAYGKSTRINDGLELLPLSLQVQLCLMEHASLYEAQAPDATANETLIGLKRLTRLAYCFSDPEAAYDTLTQNCDDETKRRDFDRESFRLAVHFNGAEEIDLLSGHLSKEMGLLEAANPPMPAPEKKTRRMKPVRSHR